MLLRIFLSITSFIVTRSASAPAPAPQGVTDPCNSITTYSDLQESAVWLGNWSMTGASAVTSNSEPANLEATYSESVGITITVGVELGADLPDEVAEAGLSASISWSKFDTNGWTAGVDCPPGDPLPYSCGLSAIPHLVNISGSVSTFYESGNCDNRNGQNDTTAFQYWAPVTDTDTVAPNGGHHNLFTFAACICNLSKNQTTEPGLGPCPAPSC